jgi:hypothetical protein
MAITPRGPEGEKNHKEFLELNEWLRQHASRPDVGTQANAEDPERQRRAIRWVQLAPLFDLGPAVSFDGQWGKAKPVESC